MSKPRTQEELDEQERMERSIEEAAYIDYGIQRWKRRYEPQYVSDQYDQIHASDTKTAQTFPKERK